MKSDIRARRADAMAAIAESFLEHGTESMNSCDRHQIIVHVSAETLRGDASDFDAAQRREWRAGFMARDLRAGQILRFSHEFLEATLPRKFVSSTRPEPIEGSVQIKNASTGSA
jgi:hypothetical protein